MSENTRCERCFPDARRFLRRQQIEEFLHRQPGFAELLRRRRKVRGKKTFAEEIRVAVLVVIVWVDRVASKVGAAVLDIGAARSTQALNHVRTAQLGTNSG